MAVFSSLHREIGQKCPQELSRDPTGAKGFAAFLTELAERIPAILMSSMCILLDHLDGEVGGTLGISCSGDLCTFFYQGGSFHVKLSCLVLSLWHFLPVEKQIKFIE